MRDRVWNGDDEFDEFFDVVVVFLSLGVGGWGRRFRRSVVSVVVSVVAEERISSRSSARLLATQYTPTTVIAMPAN